MKSIFKYLGLAVMSMAILSLTACNNDDNKKEDNQTPTTGNAVYKLHLGATDSQALADGDTVDYEPARWERDLNMTQAIFYIENCTSAPVMTTQTYEFVEGQTGQLLEICAGGNCPWNGQPYEVAVGVDDQKPVTVEVGLSDEYTGVSIVKLKVGRAETMADAVTVYLRVHLG